MKKMLPASSAKPYPSPEMKETTMSDAAAEAMEKLYMRKAKQRE